MPPLTPHDKFSVVKRPADNAVLFGGKFQYGKALAVQMVAERAFIFTPTFDRHEIIVFQASVCFELIPQLHGADAILFPFGGGALSAASSTRLSPVETVHNSHRRRANSGRFHVVHAVLPQYQRHRRERNNYR